MHCKFLMSIIAKWQSDRSNIDYFYSAKGKWLWRGDSQPEKTEPCIVLVLSTFMHLSRQNIKKSHSRTGSDRRGSLWKPLAGHRRWCDPSVPGSPARLQTLWWYDCSENMTQIIAEVEKDVWNNLWGETLGWNHASEWEHGELTKYLEKRPLKKAFTSNCGFGMMPAFR